MRRPRPRRVPRRRRRARRAARPSPARTRTSSSPGVGYEELRAALEPHGRVEDLEVAGRRVGVRLFPRDRRRPPLAPAGIEFAPPRVERARARAATTSRSSPTRRSRSRTTWRRRDFTVNAMARSLETRRARRPVRRPRAISSTASSARSRPTSFARRPAAASSAACASSRSSASSPTRRRSSRCASRRRRCALVSGERIGGGLAADGMGELSKLLLGARAGDRRCGSRATPACSSRSCPEFEPAIGFDQDSRYHGSPLDEHLFAGRAGRGRRRARRSPCGSPLLSRPRQAGSPGAATTGACTTTRTRRSASAARGRGRRARGRGARAAALPDRAARAACAGSSGGTCSCSPRHPDAAARAALPRPARDELAFDLVAHKEADLRGKGTASRGRARASCATLPRPRSSASARSPHRLRDLAIDGDDLIALGYRPGPALGATLERAPRRGRRRPVAEHARLAARSEAEPALSA